MSTSDVSPDSSPASTPAPNGGIGRWLLRRVTVVLLAAWLTTFFLFVDETEVVIVERLGRIVAVYDRPEERGLAVKLPWPVSTARRFDWRTQLLDPAGREMFTRDRKNITVDAFVCWRIARPQETTNSDPQQRPAVRFFRSLGTIETAQARLETRLRSAVAARIAQVELTDLMHVTDPQSPPDMSAAVSLDSISSQLLADVKRRPDEDESVLDRMGIEIVDVRIKRINFPVGNQQAVFERMKSERQKIADRYRSAGLAENSVIRSQADRQHSEIISRAEAEAERIRGRAEAESLAILNTAHARDPEFYRLTRSLDAAKKVLNDRTTLVLSASSGFLKLLVEGVPEPSGIAAPGTPTTAPAAVAPEAAAAPETKAAP